MKDTLNRLSFFVEMIIDNTVKKWNVWKYYINFAFLKGDLYIHTYIYIFPQAGFNVTMNYSRMFSRIYVCDAIAHTIEM